MRPPVLECATRVLVAALLWVVMAAGAQACAIPRQKHDVLQRDYPAIVTARVTGSRLMGLEAWRADYRVTSLVKGWLPRTARLRDVYEVGCCPCNPRRMIPLRGQTYVLYLVPDAGRWRVDGFLRLHEARKIDPRVN